MSMLQGRSDVTSLRDENANVDDVAIVETIAGRNVSLRCTVFGIPSASVSWWHDNRLVSNGSKLEHAWEDQVLILKQQQKICLPFTEVCSGSQPVLREVLTVNKFNFSTS